MSSIFTFQDEPPRIQSPWSTPGTTTPQLLGVATSHESGLLRTYERTRLEPEKQDGPCEYKLHLLLRARRQFASMSTASPAALPLHTRFLAPNSLPGTDRSVSETLLQRSTYQPSPQTRQARLQQLTTQLLWRLQQSSPFHSSSNAELVLPVLPEATPRLGVPERPAKLLPGLEESQGALYEIGVADDGTLVGLAEDELEESLNNLRAMAASLGCVVDILRKVAVGSCEWVDQAGEDKDTDHRAGDLYVAEVLVRPDSRAGPDVASSTSDLHKPPDTTVREAADPAQAHAEQLRIALAGASAAGKSSLLGTLTTSVLDNSRGLSRLSLLKHRHEITSGITSSVAHELIGYKAEPGPDDFVVNYASGDVSTWTDIHSLADRLCFMSDSPGLSRFAKSTFRALVSWKPDWTLFCAAADDNEIVPLPAASGSEAPSPSTGTEAAELTLAHLDLCLRLGLPLLVVITKMDLATKTGLRAVLSMILSALKSAGRKPMLLSTASTPVPSFALDSAEALPDIQRVRLEELGEVDKAIAAIKSDPQTVPIVMTSAVTGSGIGKLHALLCRLPVPAYGAAGQVDRGIGEASPLFHVDEVFGKPPVRIYNAEQATRHGSSAGVVLCGRVACGTIKVGDRMRIGPFMPDDAMAHTSFPRSKSFSAQDLQRASRGAPGNPAMARLDANSHLSTSLRPSFLPVKVVSLRNLRLPVLQMGSGETGTVGIEPESSGFEDLSVQKARKGMVLTGDSDYLQAFRSFIAAFPAKDFLVASPPLLLGGNALAYVNSIRAAVKVVALALVEDESIATPSSTEVFTFDGDLQETDELSGREVRITFKFVSSVEYMEVGDQVLLVPTMSAAGPVTGPTTGSSSLAGFVGSVFEVVQ